LLAASLFAISPVCYQASDIRGHQSDEKPQSFTGDLHVFPVAMTIAGSDPSGGAGLQADLKTFHQHGVFGTSVVTLLTVQNTRTVKDVRIMDADFVLAQLDAVVEDLPPAAAKTGALGSPAIISAIAERANEFSFPIVVDPVMISKHGKPLMAEAAISVLIEKLLPTTFLVTPNLAEATKILGMPVDSIATMQDAARRIAGMGPPHVLIKGGHLEGDAVDVLLSNDEIHVLRESRLETSNTHGTGCVTSAAITAGLANGRTVPESVRAAKQFVTRAIQTNPKLGGGYGPVNMFAEVDD
jgi:hydroxymethylpyrimidine/phosphomethylpyrimidine kinase